MQEREERGISALDSDDEDEEQIEPEDEYDRAFIDDAVEDDGVDFYRWIDRDLDERDDDVEGIRKESVEEQGKRKRPH